MWLTGEVGKGMRPVVAAKIYETVSTLMKTLPALIKTGCFSAGNCYLTI
jgi:hypothetical protein